jgi:excisionase family DNA binding protein
VNDRSADPFAGNTKQRPEPPGREEDNAERKVLDVRGAAIFLGVSESLVRRLIRERRIPFFQIDGRYLFYRPALEYWIEDQIVHPGGMSGSNIATEAAHTIWKRSKGE